MRLSKKETSEGILLVTGGETLMQHRIGKDDAFCRQKGRHAYRWIEV